MLLKMVKLTRSGGSLVIAIPRDVRKLFNWNHGTELVLIVKENVLIVRRWETSDTDALIRGAGVGKRVPPPGQWEEKS